MLESIVGLYGNRFTCMKWYPNIQYHQHHPDHHDQSLKRLKMATALSESIVGVAINWRPPFHFSIHEMISPRGCLSYNPGNTAGCIRRYGHSYISIICTQVIPANIWGLHFKMTPPGPDFWLCVSVREYCAWRAVKSLVAWKLNIARGTTDPGYRVYNLSYLSS